MTFDIKGELGTYGTILGFIIVLYSFGVNELFTEIGLVIMIISLFYKLSRFSDVIIFMFSFLENKGLKEEFIKEWKK